jgi:cell envelope opacity-associated protein A
MSTILTAVALVALSVSKLEEELKKAYTPEVLTEAIKLEEEKEEPRKTALEALEAALEEATPKPTVEKKEYTVCEGKTLTSRKGIVTAGDVVTEKHFAGGSKTIENLKAKGFLK